MSTHDLISLMLQFGLFLITTLSLVVTIMKLLLDASNKKK